MKAKTIRICLRRKINEWLESINSEIVVDLIKRDCIVTGGSITSMLMGNRVNDYDIYFKTAETAEAVARYYLKLLKKNPPAQFKAGGRLKDSEVVISDSGRVSIKVPSAGILSESSADADYEYFEFADPEGVNADEYVSTVIEALEPKEGEKLPRYRPIFLTSNAITLANDIQLIIRFYGKPEEIHENFDFVHCTCWYDYQKKHLELPPEALQAMLAKNLVYKSSLYPLCSIIRTRKFIAAGWRITAGQFVKMAWDLNKLDLTEIDVLEDQMIGVDAAYFHEICDLLRKKDAKTVDETYLMTLIDRLF